MALHRAQGDRGRAAVTLSITRAIASIDCEATSPDPVTARIIEFACVTLYPDGTRQGSRCLINPGVPIPPASTAVHHITDLDVVGCPTFAAMAPQIVALLTDVDITGYNIRRYDIVLIEAELARCGLPVPWDGAAIVDSYEVHQKLHPAKLTDAVRRYCGRDLDNAHSALADAAAALDVLVGQLAFAPNLPREPAALEEAVVPDYVRQAIDPGGKLRMVDGEVVLGFSKHKGEPLTRVDSGFLNWMLAPQRVDEWHPRVVAAVRGEISRRGAAGAFAARAAQPARR